MTYYGQFETDKVIETYFVDKTDGVCIEVGASDGIKGSNTFYFEKKGWEVYCIEPIPVYAEMCKKIRKNVLEYACSNYIGTSLFNVIDIGKNNILSSLSSLDTDKRLFNTHGHLINNISAIEVQVITLEKLIERYKIPKPNFISIDTEGTELDVLKGINFEKHLVPLLVVENNFNDSNHRDYLKNYGYTLDQRYEVNDFYIL